MYCDTQLVRQFFKSSQMPNNFRTYSLAGAYRKVFIKPENLSWKLQPYENETDNLILSDLDELNETTLTEYPGKIDDELLYLILI